MHFAKALFVTGIAMIGFAAYADAATPVVAERQENQAGRIQQGVASGELSKQEAARLRVEQKAIRVEKRAFKADGKVTQVERAQLRRDQNAASRHIYNKKHNDKKAG
jgi:predicted transposase YdaD